MIARYALARQEVKMLKTARKYIRLINATRQLNKRLCSKCQKKVLNLFKEGKAKPEFAFENENIYCKQCKPLFLKLRALYAADMPINDIKQVVEGQKNGKTKEKAS